MAYEYEFEVCVKRDYIDSILDMLRYDDVRIDEIEHQKDDNICVRMTSSRFTELRWKSFGLNPVILEKRQVRKKTIKNKKQGWLCSEIDEGDRGGTYLSLIAALRGMGDVFVNDIKWASRDYSSPLQFCIGFEGEAKDVDGAINSLQAYGIDDIDGYEVLRNGKLNPVWVDSSRMLRSI